MVPDKRCPICGRESCVKLRCVRRFVELSDANERAAPLNYVSPAAYERARARLSKP